MRDHPKRDLRLDSGVVFENQSARFSWKVPPGFRCEFRPVFPANIQASQDKPADLLRKGGLYNTVVVRGELPAGQTVRLVFNRVFDFPGHTLARIAAPSPARRTAAGFRGDGLGGRPDGLEGKGCDGLPVHDPGCGS